MSEEFKSLVLDGWQCANVKATVSIVSHLVVLGGNLVLVHVKGIIVCAWKCILNYFDTFLFFYSYCSRSDGEHCMYRKSIHLWKIEILNLLRREILKFSKKYPQIRLPKAFGHPYHGCKKNFYKCQGLPAEEKKREANTRGGGKNRSRRLQIHLRTCRKRWKRAEYTRNPTLLVIR
jgi:hypothetical protein